ncbi:YbaB/EbfC family nucleoid-associated protein [Amycolatopsis mongoliensis]|uniref:YbaB/EbfC family nucleoid-associated protein n=1 Tax=Amycolatopsis mongoliensis TaxID=715475 RepID=A0A9Y2JY61_9PSEU|nr:YbaB/EbfC family nucleoid-associated protein [Amycolatopsis sp. 4-36]WIY05119.1 YbaB/EbfC family nucleoid-associated protein [Amycolatopsis sp. 4-36]
MVFNADVMRRQADELDAELEQVRFTGQSRDGAVTAVVSGHGRLIDLRISAAVMRGAHPQTVGPDVVEAVSAARRAAAGPALAKMRAVLDKDQVWQPQSAGARPDQPAPAGDYPPPAVSPAAERRPREEVGEEDFGELDFLTDDDSDDEDRGRW